MSAVPPPVEVEVERPPLPVREFAVVAEPATALPRLKFFLALFLPVLAGAGAYAAAVGLSNAFPARYPKAVAPYYAAEVPEVARPEPDGVRLYVQHCASCHGERGDGQGVAQLYPKARFFGHDKFKFASTTNGVPTDDDLLGLLRRGIPGSAMPRFDHLPADELLAVIGHVRSLARAGVVERLRRKADKDGDDFDYAAAVRAADAQTKVGEPLKVPAIPPTSPEAVERGRAVFLGTGGCNKCHGDLGRGDGPQVADMKNEDGTVNRPRDLTAGIFKVSGEPTDLYARIRLGIPGTPMPSAPHLSEDDVRNLIHFVRSLSARPN